MNDFEKTYAEYQATVAEANGLNKTTVFDALAAAGITSVTATFDGEGDSGQLDDVIAYADGQQAKLPPTQLTIRTTSWGSSTVGTCEKTLPEAVEELCYSYLEEKYAGWENNDGAYGEFLFDVKERTIELEFHGRFVDVTDERHTL